MKRNRKQKARKRVPPLKVHHEDEQPAVTSLEAERLRRDTQVSAEEFWAGRNRAMRQSARVAA